MTIIIVTDKFVTAVNCPIEFGIVPLSELLKKYLLISRRTHCCHQYTNTNSNRTNKTIVIVTDKLVSAVNCPIEVTIVPLSWLLPRYLLISQSTHCCHQHTNTNRVTARQLVIVTDNSLSAVNCPINVGIVPLS